VIAVVELIVFRLRKESAKLTAGKVKTKPQKQTGDENQTRDFDDAMRKLKFVKPLKKNAKRKKS
jgi:hypothetical protein